jgi:hypothetical protein
MGHIREQEARVPLPAGAWLGRYMKEMADTHGRADSIAHIAKPVADGGENLAIAGDGDMRLVESLWGIAKIREGLARLFLACLERAHPESNGKVFFSGAEQPILNRHTGILLIACAYANVGIAGSERRTAASSTTQRTPLMRRR